MLSELRKLTADAIERNQKMSLTPNVTDDDIDEFFVTYVVPNLRKAASAGASFTSLTIISIDVQVVERKKTYRILNDTPSDAALAKKLRSWCAELEQRYVDIYSLDVVIKAFMERLCERWRQQEEEVPPIRHSNIGNLRRYALHFQWDNE